MRCSRCGLEQPAQNHCRRCGCFLLLNTGALKGGLRRYETRGVLSADLRVSIEGFQAQLVSDAGGLEDLSAARAALIRSSVHSETLERLAMNVLIRAGLHTKDGKAAFDRVLAAIDRKLRLLQALGLERRAKQVNVALELQQLRVEHEAQTAPQRRHAASGAAADAEADAQQGEPA